VLAVGPAWAMTASIKSISSGVREASSGVADEKEVFGAEARDEVAAVRDGDDVRLGRNMRPEDVTADETRLKDNQRALVSASA
jgi:hypothetical protein